MSLRITHKMLSLAALAVMAVTPAGEIAQARISATGPGAQTSQHVNASGATASGGRISATGSVNGSSGSNATGSVNGGSRVGASGTQTGGRISATGPATSGGSGGNRVSAGSNGCSLLPGGYCYNPNNNRISAGGPFYGGRVPAGGRISATGPVSGGSRVGASGGYGCSAVAGGYCYTPGNRVSATGSTSGGRISATGPVASGSRVSASGTQTGGRISATGPVSDGNRVSATGYGCSAIPGGYCYDPNRINAAGPSGSGNRIDATGSSNTGNRIDATGSSNSGNRIDATGPQESQEVTPAEETEEQEPSAEPVSTEEISACNGRPYPKDIDGHWAEIYVRRLYDLCIIEGYGDGTFKPQQHVTRAELVKMALYSKDIEPDAGCYDNDCGTPFDDLDAWQGKWIRPAYFRNVVEGYDHNKFRPNQSITRAEAVKVVLATYGYSPVSTNRSFFNDVHGWSVGWVERAHEIGLVQGIGNGNFDPNRPITRAEAAKIIAKMMEHWDTEIQ